MTSHTYAASQCEIVESAVFDKGLVDGWFQTKQTPNFPIQFKELYALSSREEVSFEDGLPLVSMDTQIRRTRAYTPQIQQPNVVQSLAGMTVTQAEWKAAKGDTDHEKLCWLVDRKCVIMGISKKNGEYDPETQGIKDPPVILWQGTKTCRNTSPEPIRAGDYIVARPPRFDYFVPDATNERVLRTGARYMMTVPVRDISTTTASSIKRSLRELPRFGPGLNNAIKLPESTLPQRKRNIERIVDLLAHALTVGYQIGQNDDALTLEDAKERGKLGVPITNAEIQADVNGGAQFQTTPERFVQEMLVNPAYVEFQELVERVLNSTKLEWLETSSKILGKATRGGAANGHFFDMISCAM